MNRTLRALNRFGLGARIGEATSLGDPTAWLRDQLDRPVPSVDGAPELDEVAAALRGLRQAQQARDQARLAEARGALADLQAREARAALGARVSTEAPFVERLVAFWSNHLCVSIPSKPQVAALAGHYERTVIRPHVLGRFRDMVLASARHPAMLFYLDNFQSIGPGSAAGRRTARRGNGRGLNENYARELLELHTLGVDGGYAQADVEQLARILTGWSVEGAGPAATADDGLDFAFRPMTHEPGDKTVLGRRYRESGVREGEQVIRDLCEQPATARFVAIKLARHFVADEPPGVAVDALAATFADSDGDLRAIADALIDLEDAWRPEHVKFRAPQDWLVAVLRALDVGEVPAQAPQLLRQLRHPLWAPPAPKGFGDLEREWADPDGLMNRAELARSLAGRVAQAGRDAGRGPEPERFQEVVDVAADDPLRAMLADDSIRPAERIALALSAPAFQWR